MEQRIVDPNTKRVKERIQLTGAQVLIIRDDFADGWPAQIISLKRALSITVVRQCVTGKTFAGYLGETVDPKLYYKANKINLEAYHKVMARLPKGSTFNDVDAIHLNVSKGRVVNKANMKEARRDCNLCHSCEKVPGTVSYRIIVDNQQVVDQRICMKCFMSFTMDVQAWM